VYGAASLKNAVSEYYLYIYICTPNVFKHNPFTFQGKFVLD